VTEAGPVSEDQCGAHLVFSGSRGAVAEESRVRLACIRTIRGCGAIADFAACIACWIGGWAEAFIEMKRIRTTAEFLPGHGFRKC